MTELANYLDLPPSTIHGHLATLRKHTYLTKEGDEYHIGLQFLNQGGYAQTRKKGYELAEEKVNQIAEQTGERVQFIAEERGRGSISTLQSAMMLCKPMLESENARTFMTVLRENQSLRTF